MRPTWRGLIIVFHWSSIKRRVRIRSRVRAPTEIILLHKVEPKLIQNYDCFCSRLHVSVVKKSKWQEYCA